MNLRGIKKFILPLLVLIIIFLVFTSCSKTSSTGGSGGLALGLGQGPKNPFTNISRFGQVASTTPAARDRPIDPNRTANPATTITNYPSGKKINLSFGNIPSEYPDGSPFDPNDRIEYLVLFDGFEKYVTKNYGSMRPPNSVQDVMKAKSSSEVQNIIKTLNSKDATALFYAAYAATFTLGTKLKDSIDYCVANPTKEECNGFDLFVWCTNELLNTDLIKGIPKVGSGWDEYKIQSVTVNSDTKLVITPSINFSSKKIKSVVLKFRGKEKGTGSRVVVNLTGVDKSGSALPSTQSTSTSFFDDPEDFHYTIFPLDLNYPVTITALSINLNCPSTCTSAAIDDAVICFIYN